MDVFRKHGAKAIWKDHEVKENRFVRFQTEFQINDISDVEFFICTDTKYELYINSELVGFGQYDDFPTHKAYDRINITKSVKKGKNLVSILAWAAGKDYPSMHLTGLPMVIFTALNGQECILASNSNVKCDDCYTYTNGEIEHISQERVFNFGFDLRNDDLWISENISSNWSDSVECDDSEIEYYQRPVENLALGDIVCGKVITQGVFIEGEGETPGVRMQFAHLAYRDKEDVISEDGEALSVLCDNAYWVTDLGEEMAGHIVIDVEAEDGAVMDIAIGEHLADLRVRSYVTTKNYAFRCVCREGRQQMRFYIQRLAGRYLQIFNHKGIKKVYNLGLHEVYYPFSFRSSLKTNDRLMNRIYDVSAKTLDLCVHEHYEDCPQREQSLYGMDSRNQMLAGYYAFGETKMPRASLDLLGEGQHEDGLLEITSPCKFMKTIPCFTLAWICAIKEYALFSGDIDFLKEIFPRVKKGMEYFKLDEKAGLIKRPMNEDCWNYYEWADGMHNWDSTQEGFDAPLNAFYAMTLIDFCDICRFTGNTAELTWAKDRLEKIRSSFHNAFYCKEKNAYKTYINGHAECYSQLTQAWAILGGCVPEEYKEEIMESMLSDRLTAVSLSHSVYKYDALMLDSEKYGEYVLEDIASQWGYMLYNGATSFWESIDGESGFGRAASLCHGWSATPVYVFWRYIMGIYPQDAGFKDISPEPKFSDINAKGTLKTPQGIFNVSLSGGSVTFEKDK